MELNEQHEYRDLLSSIPFPSYPSDILWKPIRVSSSGLLFSSTKISLIIAWIPESESCHDSKNCPSHKPMRTHWENDLLYIFAFLKAWTMAYRWNRFWEASRCFDKAGTSTSHQTDTPSLSRLVAMAQELLWFRGDAVLKQDQLVVSMSCCFQLSASAVSTSYSMFFSLQTLQALGFIFCSLYSAFWGGCGCCLRNMVAAEQKGSKSGQGSCLMHFWESIIKMNRKANGWFSVNPETTRSSKKHNCA